MPSVTTQQNLRQHRKRLLSALRDCEAGKMSHLNRKEVDVLVAHLKQRIAKLDALLVGVPG